MTKLPRPQEAVCDVPPIRALYEALGRGYSVRFVPQPNRDVMIEVAPPTGNRAYMIAVDSALTMLDRFLQQQKVQP
jgi:hypothetical protein